MNKNKLHNITIKRTGERHIMDMKSKTHQNSFQITELSALRIMKKVYKNATSHEYVEKEHAEKEIIRY